MKRFIRKILGYFGRNKPTTMPYSANLIAYAFAKRGIEELNYVTQMKLQKMVYIAHGYHLARYDSPLIEETFEAWKFGPVVPSIYREYNWYGKSPITSLKVGWVFSRSVSIEHNINLLNENALTSIDFTWKLTKDIDAIVLSNWTHVTKPWKDNYNPNIDSIPIPNKEIRAFFEEFLGERA